MFYSPVNCGEVPEAINACNLCSLFQYPGLCVNLSPDLYLLVKCQTRVALDVFQAGQLEQLLELCILQEYQTFLTNVTLSKVSDFAFIMWKSSIVVRITLVTARKRNCGKVMFLHLSVYSQRGWLSSMYHRSHDQHRGRGSVSRRGLHPGGSAYREVCIQGVCLQGDLYRGGVGLIPPAGTRKAGSTHPTGMLSCMNIFLQNFF